MESGARNVDNILTNTLLPEISRLILEQMADGTQADVIRVGMARMDRSTYSTMERPRDVSRRCAASRTGRRVNGQYSQANRPMLVETALAKDELLLERFSAARRRLSPFHYTLDLLSENPSVAAAEVLQKAGQRDNQGGPRRIGSSMGW